jgi:hypothetical protein
VETTGNSERIRNQKGHNMAPQVCHEEKGKGGKCGTEEGYMVGTMGEKALMEGRD